MSNQVDTMLGVGDILSIQGGVRYTRVSIQKPWFY